MTITDCMPRETLKQYLAGWIDAAQTQEIERHVAECPACEQTIIELESDPDTLLESIRQGGQRNESSPDPDAVLRKAVSQVKRLMDVEPSPVGSSIQPASGSLGVYELIHPLGRGGMGTVYLARHKTLGKQVAVKLLPAIWAVNEEAAARFQREIRAAGKLNHRSIVSATDAGQQQGTHYLVMEYIDGMDLSRIARLVGRLKIADACELARQVALGLSYAHAEGIVHRDVKPSNLMLDEHGHVKILDFGLAQLSLWDEASAELTSVGQLMGTLDYMAPEQAERSGSVDYRADLYSLGATLFRLLCGRAPLVPAANLSPLHKLRLLVEHRPPRLDTLREDVPGELVQLVGSLLSRHADDRPASAAHVAEQLAPFTPGADLSGLLVQARSAESQSINSPEDREAPAKPQLTLSPARKFGEPGGGSRRLRRWLIGAAFFALLIFGGVLIVLETQKGQLVIDSDVAGVHVKLLRDGQPVRDLQIDTGTTSTRLAADKYEIVLDSPSDSVTIDKNEFLLKNGRTVVARIRTKEASPAKDVLDPTRSLQYADPLVDPYSPLPTVPGSSTSSNEPVYDGKPLDAWLSQLSRERSPKVIGEALMAIKAMANKETAQRITDTLAKVLQGMNGDQTFKDSDNTISGVDYKGFEVLAAILPGQEYFEFLAKMLDEGDTAWGKRILTIGAFRRTAVSEDEIEPLLTWVTKNVLEVEDLNRDRKQLIGPSAWWLRSFLESENATEGDGERIAERVLTVLEQCPHLGDEFWLAQPPTSRWSPKLRNVVFGHAFDAIKNPAISPKYVAQSTMIFAEMLSASSEIAELAKAEIIEAVQSRLRIIANDRARLLQLVEADYYYRGLSGPHVPHVASSGGGFAAAAQSVVTFEVSGSTVSEVIELMELAYLLKMNYAAKFDMGSIAEMTRLDYRVVDNLIRVSDSRRFDGPFFPRVQITWPSFSTKNFAGIPRSTRLEELSSKTWLAYLIHIQAAELGDIPLPMTEANPKESAGKKE